MDTRDHRASAMLVGLPWKPLPLPDGAIQTVDRPLLAWVYGGISALTIAFGPTCVVGQVYQGGVQQGEVY